MQDKIINTTRTNDFESSGRAVLALLHQRFGFNLWMLTRKEGDDWIVLQSEDHGYGVEAGKVFCWADSFCSEMVKGNGPSIAPRSELIPAYATAPIGRQVLIQSYIGLPIRTSDGNLFGTLCAIHPEPMPESLTGELELLKVIANLLSSILQADLKDADALREMERLRLEAHTDVLTGLYNRRAWVQLLESEEDRCRRYGHPCAVLLIDLDGLKKVNDSHGHIAGDQMIKATGMVLKQVARKADVIARVGGDEFCILSSNIDLVGAEALYQRVRNSLDEAGIPASIGISMRDPASGLMTSVKEADRMMYAEKQARKPVLKDLSLPFSRRSA